MTENSRTLCQLLFDDLRELQSQGLPETLAYIYRYPDDSHHKGFSGIAVQNALGWPPIEVFSVIEDETVTDCFTYSTVTGPTEGFAIHQLRMTLLQHTVFLADLLGGSREEIVSHWMVALARTDIGYSPDTLAVFGSDGITSGTFGAVPNVIKASIVLLTMLTSAPQTADLKPAGEVDDSEGESRVPAATRQTYMSKESAELVLSGYLETGDSRLNDPQEDVAKLIGCSVKTLKKTETYRRIEGKKLAARNAMKRKVSAK